MVDITETAVTPAASTAAPISDAPVSPTSVTSDIPATESSSVAMATESTVAEPVKVEAEASTTIESVLGEAKATEVKPEAITVEKKDTAKTEGDKPADVKAETLTEVKAELPVYEPFKLPENVNLDKEALDAFTNILGEIETGKLDHLGMQEKGQALIDLATKATTDSINRLNDFYVQFHENQKKEWFENFKKDPDLGGAKLDETVGLLRDAVENYGGTAEQVKEFRQLMKDTGVGNHPALTRILYNMQQKINKYTTEGDAQRMVPGGRPAPSKVKDYQRFYTAN